ncbi:hypothetical protein HPB47_007347 [Ixodes persulcatus]|uniref:Uncharacterized protein n=1 Tax=Ixodes persulcatus TaxID=34615 RepID=A0AC60P7P9_IXOPE|nr:hypothetical protein HPB47_007347 [Ixodes persulcatus]
MDPVVLECEPVLQSIVEATVLSAERLAVDEVLSKTEMRTYHALQVTGSYPKLKNSTRQHYQEMTSQESTFFEKNVVCANALDMCMDTLQQSKCARWGCSCISSSRGYVAALMAFLLKEMAQPCLRSSAHTPSGNP